ncbi:uncharacterized protein LOC130184996 isoform X2 [Seriola aureovittata]|uniref:uncharacterized protein LOC130184996 isoform X2 n=1 Tax=Seriola aureovittata TaxID=2871759 RepID=UPI0024BD84FB|nr:uncharacterized protein LOC130184996 isoform X2 [Seriola aureovittata]
MALGCLLCVSWICFLLFDGSAGLPALKGYGYPYTADSRNLADDGENEGLTSLTFEGYWPTSNSQPADGVYTSYNKPLVSQQPVSFPAQQKLPNTPGAPQVARLVNGMLRNWGLENLDKPLIFPLRINYQLGHPEKSQPGPIQPQSPSFNVASSNSLHASPSTGGATHYASSTAYYDPASSYTSQAAKSPSSDSWQPEPVNRDHGVADLNTGSSAHGGDSSNVPHLVFEDVFQYPSANTEPAAPSHGGISNAGGYSQAHYVSEGSLTENALETSFPSYPANVGAHPSSAFGKGSSSSSYQPHERTSPQLPQKPVIGSQVASQRVSEPIPPPPPSYISQSRTGYQRGGYLYAKSIYSPEFPPPPPIPVSLLGVKRPAMSYRAAPKGVKNPQSAKW